MSGQVFSLKSIALVAWEKAVRERARGEKKGEFTKTHPSFNLTSGLSGRTEDNERGNKAGRINLQGAVFLVRKYYPPSQY
jgi:hypothetical protein